ncbi:anti-sigma factor family protein [Streptacidiphilus cavernicola]|uniref:Anti-sigma factor n=1 Tax=Streptacidiphilus cavernicola TaxID=3342716 RepID=A0ABV6W2R2_9ACTN
MTTPCPQSVSLGAYLLGALDPEERRAMELHVAGCEQCRAELVELAPLPGLLRHTAFEELPETAEAAESLGPAHWQPEPPRDGGSPTGDPRGAAPRADGPQGSGPEAFGPQDGAPQDGGSTGVAGSGGAAGAEPRVGGAGGAHHRRPPRRRLVAAGLTLAACVTGLAVYAAVGRDNPSPGGAKPVAATWSATDPATHVSASAEIIPEAWGTQFELRLGGLPSGITCHLVVHGKDGSSETAGTWGSGYSSSASVPASTSISPADITGLSVIDGAGGTLVQLPPG